MQCSKRYRRKDRLPCQSEFRAHAPGQIMAILVPEIAVARLETDHPVLQASTKDVMAVSCCRE